MKRLSYDFTHTLAEDAIDAAEAHRVLMLEAALAEEREFVLVLDAENQRLRERLQSVSDFARTAASKQLWHDERWWAIRAIAEGRG